MKVEILGHSGCSTCESLKLDAERIVDEIGKEDEIDVER